MKILLDKYNSIMEREESHRKSWALGLTVIVFSFILVGFATYKGLIGFGNIGSEVVVNNSNNDYGQLASVGSLQVLDKKNENKKSELPSPVENTKETFKEFFDEMKMQYDNITESVSSVIVPFITSIDVYQRE